MLKDCKLFKDIKPLEWWLDKVKLAEYERIILSRNAETMKQMNGDINDFSFKLDNEGTEDDYCYYKEQLFSKLLNSNIKPDDFELLMHKRATVHIKELFDRYVDDDTLVIISDFNHISVENPISKCKNVIRLDRECEDNNQKHDVLLMLATAKTFKKVFVYVIGTEFECGRRHSNIFYKELHDRLKEMNIPTVMVLDAVQEMFLFPRDYSFYDFIIGTVHSLVHLFDTGLLFINKNLVPEEDIKYFTGYKRVDILKKINDGLDIILQRKDYILMYRDIINDSIDWDLFRNYNLHNSQSNFFSIYTSGKFLYDNKCIDFINEKFVEHSKGSDPGVNVEISFHKPEKELFIRVRAQTMMFDKQDIENKFNYFYDNYMKLKMLQDTLTE